MQHPEPDLPVDDPTDAWRSRLKFFPGESNGEYGMPAGLAPILDRGLGCEVWDVTGRRFLDMTMAWGSVLPGHAHPEVIAAAAAQAALGTNFASINRRSLELAESLAALVPCAQRIRFVASGTEATLLALRIAIAATGRSKVLRFEGAYHGQHPVGIAGMIHGGTAKPPFADPSGAGAPWVTREVLVAPYNDLATVETLLAAHGEEVAAVIVEPLHRCLAPTPGFLQGLRAVTRRRGIALIFDEVVTGFRLARGGAQEYYGVTPDLAAYGKALGGGFPLGACAGVEELMDVVDENRLPGPRYAWSASTTGGNPVSCAAAIAFLRLMSNPGTYERLHALGRLLREQLGATLAAQAATGQVLGDGPLAQVAFSATPVTDQKSWLASDRERSRRVMYELVRLGVFLNPMGTKLYLSLAHTETEVSEFAEKFARALLATRDRKAG